MKNLLNRVFKLDDNNTSIKTEIIAGLTTFFAMCYIVIVNPDQMTGFKGTESYELSQIWNACFIGGIIAAAIATLCMAFIANKPFALAAGMGLNSFFYVSFIMPCMLTENTIDGYHAGLAIILVSGLLFLILSLTGVRKYIAKSLPISLKTAIPAGIGLFVAFVGLQNSGLVVPNENTGVALANLTNFKNAISPIVTFIGVILIVVFSKSDNKILKKGSIILGILSSTILYYVLSLLAGVKIVKYTNISIINTFKDWFNIGLLGSFKGFKLAFGSTLLGGVFSAIMLVITYSLVDMFDTLGTLYGACAEANMLDENGDPIDLEKEMLCDSIGTVTGAITGTSTITTFVESSAGVAAGGRTGLSALVTAVLFLLCLFISPIVKYVPSCATSPALIYVGILMCKNILKVDFNDLRSATTAFMTFVIMIATYSISNGIMIGAITYVLITLLTGKYKKEDIVVTIIALLGILRFAFVAM